MISRVTAGIHHVEKVGSDPDRCAAFYRDLLGFALLRRVDDPGEDRSALLVFGDEAATPGCILTVSISTRPGQGRPGIGGVHHTAFGTADEATLLMWKRRLVDAGEIVSGPYDRGYFTSIYFRDPDGQVLEIATAGPGYAIDEPDDDLGGKLTVPPQRIVRGHRDEAAIAALTHPDAVPHVRPEMRLEGIHHISGITDDLERAGDFYEQALGLSLIKKTTNRDDPRQLHYFWAHYRDGSVADHSSFTLFGWPAHWHRTTAGIGQTDHVAFRAGSVDDLADWTEHLRSLDIRLEEADLAGPFRGIAFRAPDGLRLRLVVDGLAAE